MNLTGRMTAGTKGLKVALTLSIENTLGENTASRIACADKQHIMNFGFVHQLLFLRFVFYEQHTLLIFASPFADFFKAARASFDP